MHARLLCLRCFLVRKGGLNFIRFMEAAVSFGHFAVTAEQIYIFNVDVAKSLKSLR